VRKPLRGRTISPEEGAQVREFVVDVVRAVVDDLVDLGYPLRAEGGLERSEKERALGGAERPLPFPPPFTVLALIEKHVESRL